MKSSSIELAILEMLQNDDVHLKAQDIYHHLHPRFPAVNRSTIYRVLERLAQHGKISVSDIGTGAAVYQKMGSGMHHHLVCHKCGQMHTFEHEMVGAFFAQIEAQFDYSIHTNHLVLFGECPACRNATPAEEK